MSQANVEIARRAAEAYNRRDIDTFFAEFATPDLEWLAKSGVPGCTSIATRRCVRPA